MTPSPKLHPPGDSRAAALLRDALVWDHHACMPLRPDDPSFLPQLERHRAAGFDAVTLNVGFGEMGPEEHLAVLAAFRGWLAARPERYRIVETPEDVPAARAAGRLAVSFDIEGANAIGDRLERVAQFHALGVRWMLLAYNRPNLAGGGCQAEDEGLTSFGRALIAEMERVGLQLCLSHTGHRTAREALDAATRPVIFSHSNCAAVHAHPRNIPDDLIRACAATGGVVGINGVGIFLGPGEGGDASSATYARHVDHAVQLVGAQHVSIALDYVFDRAELEEVVRTMAHTFPPGLGYEHPPRFVAPEQLPEIVALLQGWGYGDDDLRALLGGNLLRLARQVWKPPQAA